MKLKQQADDFRVVEITDVQPGQGGPFSFYELEKVGLGTPEAVQALCRRWNLDSRRVSHGGLKDRHAHTLQYLSIYRGPKRGLKQSHFHLRYLGQLVAPYSSPQVSGNRFRVVLRDLGTKEVERTLAELGEVGRSGVPNYFDDQRFGSVGPDRRFVARSLIEEEYETALKLALTAPYEFDRAAAKEEKQLLRALWGQWSTLKARLPRGHARSLVTYLADHPSDFRGAVARLHDGMKSLYLSAYQSYLWNRMLSRWLEAECRPAQLFPVTLKVDTVWMCRGVDEAQAARFARAVLPLPSARLKLADDDPLASLVRGVLQAERIELSQMRLRHFRKPFFSRGDRPAFFQPQELAYHVEPDENHPQRKKMVLAFVLPRGCYATMLVKRITPSA